MAIQKIQLGQAGEKAAVDFLTRHGYQITEQNFRNKLGEIDIIAYDGEVLCFVEVKTRNSDVFGSPLESVTLSKQRKICHVALSYLKSKGNSEAKARFDVVAVYLDGERCRKVDLIKDAFDMNGLY
jgi:putative endonuclease